MRGMVILAIAAAALIGCDTSRQGPQVATSDASELTVPTAPKLSAEDATAISVYLIIGDLRCVSAASTTRIIAMGGEVNSPPPDPSRDDAFLGIIDSLSDFPVALEKMKHVRSEERLCGTPGYDPVKGLAAATSALETEIELIRAPPSGSL